MIKELICIAGLFPALLGAQIPANDLNYFNNERLSYTLHMSGVSAADAQFLFEKTDQFNVTVTIDTRMLTSLLFNIHNKYQTSIDTLTGLPVKVCKEIQQRNLRQSMTIHYSHTALIAAMKDGPSWKIVPEALDLFAMLYHIRAANPGVGTIISIPLDIESQSWLARGEVSDGGRTQSPAGWVSSRKIDLTFTSMDSIQHRPWKTDLLTNRIARPGGHLTIVLGPPPLNLPLVLTFGNEGKQVTMHLKHHDHGEYQ